MPVLDTNFLIALQTGDTAAEALLARMQHEVQLVPSIVAVEFLTPFGARANEAYDALKASFHVTDTNADWIRTGAQLRGRLRQEGKSIRLADFWIATWAELAATYVVTRNTKDFAAMGIPTQTW